MDHQADPRNGAAEGFAVRRTPQRAPRRRGLLRLAGVLAGLAALAGATWWLGTSSTFAVQRVESGAYRFTSRAELEGAFGNFLGRNIWTLRGRDVADSLAVLPWVRDLQVRRRLPGSIAIDFREWRPLLLMEVPAAGGKASVVVEDGRVLEFPGHLPLPSLPVLVGVSCRPDSTGRGLWLEAGQRGLVLDLVAAIEATGLESACPVDFVVARPEGFAIVLQEGRGTLVVGREEFADRLQRYMTARDHLEPGLQMDLRFAERITCRRI